MEYEIDITDYTLDEDGIVIDRDGGTLHFNDADDFIMIWNYFRHSGPVKDIIDDGKYLVMQPRKIEPYVSDYQVTGASYKLLKEWEAKEKERYNAMIANNNEELPF